MIVQRINSANLRFGSVRQVAEIEGNIENERCEKTNSAEDGYNLGRTLLRRIFRHEQIVTRRKTSGGLQIDNRQSTIVNSVQVLMLATDN